MAQYPFKMPRFILILSLFMCEVLLMPLFLSGCDLLVVGSRRITVTQLKKDLKYVSAGMALSGKEWKEMRDQLVKPIIDYYLILEYGKEEGIGLEEGEVERALKGLKGDYAEDTFKEALLRGSIDFEQWKSRLREQLLIGKIMEKATESIPPPGYQDIKDYFDAHQDEFTSPRMVDFRQIVVRTREEAQDLLKRLKKGEVFADLAREHSIAPEAEEGGEVGWVAEGQLDPSMGKVLFSLQERKISGVTKTPYGYHIFEVLSSRPGGVKGLPEVMREIEAKILRNRQEAFIKNWLEELRTRFRVEINADLLDKMELPQ